MYSSLNSNLLLSYSKTFTVAPYIMMMLNKKSYKVPCAETTCYIGWKKGKACGLYRVEGCRATAWPFRNLCLYITWPSPQTTFDSPLLPGILDLSMVLFILQLSQALTLVAIILLLGALATFSLEKAEGSYIGMANG